jgi:antirestriction protein ArdC
MDTTERNRRIADMHVDITQTVIDQIQLGLVTGEWTPPWQAGANLWSPRNPVTGKRYTAGNRFNLGLMAALSDGYGGEWATYKQWASLSRHTPECIEKQGLKYPKRAICEDQGCELVHVNKDEHGVMALRPQLRKIKGDDGVEREKLVGWFAYTVFNSTQVSGYEETYPTCTHVGTDAEQMEAADVYARTVGVQLRHRISDGAYYDPSADCISMPAHDRWTEPDRYWAVLVHEMIHWTGHPSRLDRLVPRSIVENKTYSRTDYGKEELVAELGAAFHLAHLGLSPVVREDHMQYLEGWLKILNEDPEALWRAASKAERASIDLGRRFKIAEIPKETVTA